MLKHLSIYLSRLIRYYFPQIPVSNIRSHQYNKQEPLNSTSLWKTQCLATWLRSTLFFCAGNIRHKPAREAWRGVEVIREDRKRCWGERETRWESSSRALLYLPFSCIHRDTPWRLERSFKMLYSRRKQYL